MRPFNPSAQKDIWSALTATLRLSGFNPEDFDLTAGVEVRRLGYGMSDQLFCVRRRSTGHKQLYSVAPGSPWLFSAHADLVAGRFGPPSRATASLADARPTALR